MKKASYASVHKYRAGLFLMLNYDYYVPIRSRGVVAIYKGQVKNIMKKSTSFIKRHKGDSPRTLTPSQIEKLIR